MSGTSDDAPRKGAADPALAWDEADDAPELTDALAATLRPVRDIPELAFLLRRGRPALPEAERKKRVTLHLDPDVLAALKQDGPGWQTRANAKLREALGL